ncbi:extracellular solute-binding protein [Luteipulveratus halotolerans]|uniref:ABC transporter substrate-binding protein n=1 Tax=Luteipulveratus halotolerans TaxID=1631356 RepID=A0A0L6CF81_9MICO|nr:extracellular solute-binding protein [Luteipulveratus halotolerans]KNX36442.1 ABC transporter substrate-binding protein [Luteipulveratus halotolerans]
MDHARKRRRGTALTLAAALAAGMGLAACGSDDSAGGSRTLTWYINPDVGNADATKGGQATLAKECADASGGKYRINVQLLPNSASDQRIQLLRRLAAGDTSMDLMSIDPVFVAEFAEAGYLAPVPASLEPQFREDRVQSAIEASTWNGKLVAVPFWSNTQLLWYRKSAAQQAGLDMTKPVTWDQLIAAADKSKTDIGVQASLYEGYTVWINALVAGAGGKILQNPGAAGEDTRLGLDSAAGREAARIISTIAKKGLGGPSIGSNEETQSLDLFQGKKANFLVNWPYTYGALTGDKKDVAATVYPRTVADKASAPPYGGIQIGVGAKSKNPGLAYEAAACITNRQHQADYMAKAGNPASRKASYTDAEVLKAFPNGIAQTIRGSLDVASPRPQSQYYGDISTGLQQKFSPPGAVSQQTPATAQRFIIDVLKGEALL